MALRAYLRGPSRPPRLPFARDDKGCTPKPALSAFPRRRPQVKDYSRWLDNIEPDPADLMVPYPAELMAMWPISSKFNSPAYNEPDVADPV